MHSDGPQLTQEQRARRMLGIIYLLSGGRTDIPVHRDAILAECGRRRIFWMSEEAWWQFHEWTLETVKAQREEREKAGVC